MNRLEGVTLEQRPILIAKWGKEDFLKISAINKENRSKQGLSHRLGKTPISIFKDERAKAGLPIDRLSLFLASQADNAGRSSYPTTQEMIDTISEYLEELTEEERDHPSAREKIFVDLFGKDGHGRMRCMGLAQLLHQCLVVVVHLQAI